MKLPVPQIIYYDEFNDWSFMLTTAISGTKTGTPNDEVRKPYEDTINLLADGLLMIQKVDVTDCPFIIDDTAKFQNIIDNVETNFYQLFVKEITHKYAEMERIGKFRFGKQTDRPFDNPLEMREWLINNKPQNDRCFVHGDYGLTNTFTNSGKIAGFIDFGGGGVYHKWHDIAVCVRSIGYHSKTVEDKNGYLDLFFKRLCIIPDWDKINYFIWYNSMKERACEGVI
jgi:aminoglycoside phosphotransferase